MVGVERILGGGIQLPPQKFLFINFLDILTNCYFFGATNFKLFVCLIYNNFFGKQNVVRASKTQLLPRQNPESAKGLVAMDFILPL